LVVDQLCILSEVFDVDGRSSGDHDFQFFGIKHLDIFGWYKLMESLQQILVLFLNSFRHFCIADQLHILEFVLLGYLEFIAIGHEVLDFHLTEIIEFEGEVQLHVLLDWGILENPFQTLIVLEVLLLHIFIGDRNGDDMLIEGRSEVGIKHEPIMQGFPHDSPYELEVVEMIGVDPRT
jgi:hypothetical protein